MVLSELAEFTELNLAIQKARNAALSSTSTLDSVEDPRSSSVVVEGEDAEDVEDDAEAGEDDDEEGEDGEDGKEEFGKGKEESTRLSASSLLSKCLFKLRLDSLLSKLFVTLGESVADIDVEISTSD